MVGGLRRLALMPSAVSSCQGHGGRASSRLSSAGPALRSIVRGSTEGAISGHSTGGIECQHSTHSARAPSVRCGKLYCQVRAVCAKTWISIHAFLRLSLQLHPDKSTSRTATADFQRLLAAYEVVKLQRNPALKRCAGQDCCLQYLCIISRVDVGAVLKTLW